MIYFSAILLLYPSCDKKSSNTTYCGVEKCRNIVVEFTSFPQVFYTLSTAIVEKLWAKKNPLEQSLYQYAFVVQLG